MKEVSTTIKYRDEELKLVFNLNVMQAIQEEYGTIDKWGELTDGNNSEVNVKALIFGLREMLNEGIDIENDENGTNKPFLSSKQVGRIITEVGILESTRQLNNVVVESVKDDSLKNA